MGTRSFSIAVILGGLLCISNDARAIDYIFTRIADTNGPFSGFAHGFTSINGDGSPWTNSVMAFAMYCPTPGSASIVTLFLGIRPSLTIMSASSLSDLARCLQSPIG